MCQRCKEHQSQVSTDKQSELCVALSAQKRTVKVEVVLLNSTKAELMNILDELLHWQANRKEYWSNILCYYKHLYLKKKKKFHNIAFETPTPLRRNVYEVHVTESVT